MITLTGKTALITGASRGIGRATAIMFAKAGADVVINYASNELAAAEVVSACEAQGVRALPYKANVANRAEAAALVQKTVSDFGRIDILVNNAGIWKEAAIDAMTEAQLEEMLAVNVKGVFYVTGEVVKQMKQQKSGKIIHLASTAGQRGEAFHSHYAASKGAIISLTKSLAPELAPYNIFCNCVAPGWVDTDMSHDALVAADKEKILSLIPLGRAGTAEELAGPILFLASDLSTFITGEILNVNGGAVLVG